MRRGLIALTLALVWNPVGAFAATVSNPESLRAILPDAPDTTWVEAVQGQSAYLDGPLTFDSITAYYTYYKQSASFIDEQIGILRDNRYAGGYERSWYRYHTLDQLNEEVMVFSSPASAKSAADDFKNAEASSGMTESYFDPQLGPNAYGAIVGTSAYHWSVVSFVKGDALYTVGMSSEKILKPDDVLPQARTFFTAAPSNIALPPSPQSPLSRFIVPVVATFGLGALLLGIAIVIAAIATMTQRRPSTAPSRS